MSLDRERGRDPSPQDSFGRFAKHCEHCGADSQTLGSECLSCGRSYQPQGLVDRLPDFDMEFFGAVGSTGAAIAVIGVVVFLILSSVLIAAGAVVAVLVAVVAVVFGRRRRRL